MQADIEIVANNVYGRIAERELDRDAFENSPIKGARRPIPSGAPMRIWPCGCFCTDLGFGIIEVSARILTARSCNRSPSSVKAKRRVLRSISLTPSRSSRPAAGDSSREGSCSGAGPSRKGCQPRLCARTAEARLFHPWDDPAISRHSLSRGACCDCRRAMHSSAPAFSVAAASADCSLSFNLLG